jgi:hypothetical protein
MSLNSQLHLLYNVCLGFVLLAFLFNFVIWGLSFSVVISVFFYIPLLFVVAAPLYVALLAALSSLPGSGSNTRKGPYADAIESGHDNGGGVLMKWIQVSMLSFPMLISLLGPFIMFGTITMFFLYGKQVDSNLGSLIKYLYGFYFDVGKFSLPRAINFNFNDVVDIAEFLNNLGDQFQGVNALGYIQATKACSLLNVIISLCKTGVCLLGWILEAFGQLRPSTPIHNFFYATRDDWLPQG